VKWEAVTGAHSIVAQSADSNCRRERGTAPPEGLEDPDVSLAPATATVRRALPENCLREKSTRLEVWCNKAAWSDSRCHVQVTIERTVAIEVMLDGDSPDDLLRFIAEARITGQLEHPSIVPSTS